MAARRPKVMSEPGAVEVPCPALLGPDAPTAQPPAPAGRSTAPRGSAGDGYRDIVGEAEASSYFIYTFIYVFFFIHSFPLLPPTAGTQWAMTTPGVRRWVFSAG